jgi:hypothetical protein
MLIAMTDHELPAAALVTAARTGNTLDTLAALLKCNHGLAAHFPTCGSWSDLDLAHLIAQGHGERRLDYSFGRPEVIVLARSSKDLS